jgi:hypothetical protein
MGSASAVADGFVTMLSATSCLGAGGTLVESVAKDSYKVLETAASAACVVSWTGFASTPSRGTREQVWNFQLRLFIRDLGNPIQTLQRSYSVPQLVLNTLHSDLTVQGAAVEIQNITGTNTPGDVWETGGQIWLHIPITCVVLTTLGD